MEPYHTTPCRRVRFHDAAMTETQWRALLADPVALARFQALELLSRPWYAAEWSVPDRVQIHRWAIAVLAGDQGRARDDTFTLEGEYLAGEEGRHAR